MTDTYTGWLLVCPWKTADGRWKPPLRGLSGMVVFTGARGCYCFNSMTTSTSGQRLATGWMEGRAMTLQKIRLSVVIESR